MIAAGYRQLLVQVVRDSAASGLLIRLSCFLAACVVAELVFAWYFWQPRFGYLLLIGLVCGTAYLWAGAFLKSAVQQNHPVYACLVPQLRSRLMTLTAALFLACTAATTIMTAALIGHGGYALACAGMLSVYILFAHRYRLLNLLPSAVILVSATMENRPLRALVDTSGAVGEPVIAGVGAILLLLLGPVALHRVFPQGGDRHWAWHARACRQLALRNGSAPGGGGANWTALFRIAYLGTLRRDSRGGATQGNMMMHSLGTAAHDGSAIAYMLASAVGMALIGRYFVARGDAVQASVTVSLMQGFLLLSCLMYAVHVSVNAVRYRVEQSLYCLAPAAPAAAQRNRVLLRTLLLRCLRLWLISVASVVCVECFVYGQLQLRGPVFALAVSMLPFAGLLMRNYARLPARPSDSMVVAMVIAGIAIPSVAVVLERMYQDWPWYWLGGGVALATLIGLRLRWRHMMALPPVLPATRLAA
jgi:hypothetical protein